MTPTDDRVQDECDRQAVILALAHLAVERPGWDDMLGRIAKRLGGEPMYLEFKTMRSESLR